MFRCVDQDEGRKRKINLWGNYFPSICLQRLTNVVATCENICRLAKSEQGNIRGRSQMTSQKVRDI
jgi:hypothetical protein